MTSDGALVAQGPVRIGSSVRLRMGQTFGRASNETGSGVRMLIVSAQGKTLSAQAFCDFRIATYSGLSFDSAVLTASHALSWLSRTDCGVLMNLTPRARSFA